MVPADELAGLMETAHLLRSPKNAQRLLAALRRAIGRKGRPEPLEKLRREMRLAARRWAGGNISSWVSTGSALLGGNRQKSCSASFWTCRVRAARPIYRHWKAGAVKVRTGRLLFATNNSRAQTGVSRKRTADWFSASSISLL